MEEERYKDILETITSNVEKKVFETVYSRTKSIDRTLVYMFNKFNKDEYAILIEDDNIKLELFNLSNGSNITIACSIKNDNIKENIINSINDSYYLQMIISSISNDSIKIECLHKKEKELHDDYEEPITRIICSIKDETLRLKEMYYYCDIEFEKYGASAEYGGFIEDGAPQIIASLTSDEEKIKMIDELQNRYNNSLHIETIIASLSSDTKKVLLLDERIDELQSPETVIATLNTDALKIEQMQKYIDKIYSFDIIITTLSTDELIIEQYELYKKMIDTFGRTKIIKSLKDDKLKEKFANQFIEESDVYDIFTLSILSITQGKEIEIGEDKSFKIDKNKIIVPYSLLLPYDEEDTYVLKNFNNEISKEILNHLFKFNGEEIRDFFSFARTLGCFSTEKLLNEDNLEQETTIGQKASSLLNELIKTNSLAIRMLPWIF